MSHLPELEVLRKELEREIAGKRIKEATVTVARFVGRHRNRPAFVKLVEGRKIEHVARRATLLALQLDDDAELMLRLGPRGTLRRERATAEPTGDVKAALTFTTGGAIHVIDPTDASEMFVVDPEQREELAELHEGGYDPIDQSQTWPAFSQRVRTETRPLRALLADPAFLVGLGDLYTDEILWHAGLAPERKPASLSTQEVRRLWRAVQEVLFEAIKQGGTSEEGGLAHATLHGEPGRYGQQLAVHLREGRPCQRCRAAIEVVDLGGGVGAHRCPACQT